MKKSRSTIGRDAWIEKQRTMSKDRTYQEVVGGLAGIIHDAIRAHHATLGQLAERARLTVNTIAKLRDGVTVNPQLYTFVRIISACDQLALLRLSELEKFNKIAKSVSKAMRPKRRKPRLVVVGGKAA